MMLRLNLLTEHMVQIESQPLEPVEHEYSLAIRAACADIILPELHKSLGELGCIKPATVDGKNITLDLVLPTFALASEREIAEQVKYAAQMAVPAKMNVTLNIYADVRPAAAQSILTPKIADVRNVILVASGKGGVGKSTVASNLAVSLARAGCQVGLLDADVYGPSVPTMFGISSAEKIEGIKGPDGQTVMLPILKHGVKLMSIGFLVDTEAAMVWRGPMIASASMQMFQQVAWGTLDYLIVDMPPGTGDIQLTIAQKVSVAGAIVVSTPQDVALADVVRAKSMFDRVKIPILGVIENMSFFICDGCDKRHEIFTHGGAKKTAEQMKLKFLGEVPLQNDLREGSDRGIPAAFKAKNTAAGYFDDISRQVAVDVALAALEYESSSQMPQVTISGEAAKKKGLSVLQ